MISLDAVHVVDRHRLTPAFRMHIETIAHGQQSPQASRVAAEMSTWPPAAVRTALGRWPEGAGQLVPETDPLPGTSPNA